MSKELEILGPIEALDKLLDGYSKGMAGRSYYDIIRDELQRLAKYEQILGNGRLTDRNYKNTTLDLDSCKPYLRLGQLEDIYEEGK